MPIYEFMCKKCEARYDELCTYNKNGKYPKVKCPECGSKSKTRLMSAFTPTFGNIRGTSKEDSFSYMAGHNMEKAKGERRYAEEHSHMGTGGHDGFYNPIDDISSGKFEGEVK